MIRVDSHHHIWTIARADDGWMTPDLATHPAILGATATTFYGI